MLTSEQAHSDPLAPISSGCCLRPRIPRRAPDCSLLCPTRRGQTWPGGDQRLRHSASPGGDDRISQVPGEHQCMHAVLSAPGGASVRCRLARRCCLPLLRQRRPPRLERFRGSITRPTHYLCTLRWVAIALVANPRPLSTKRQKSIMAKGGPGQARPPAGKIVQSNRDAYELCDVR